MARTYGQFCALARALDHVGDRWTLLVVRELLLGDATYGALRDALDGVPTNLLAERLRQLEADGLVVRATDPTDGRRVHYGLTELGLGLGPVVDELIRWGAHWMASGPGDDRFDPRWATLALRALLDEDVEVRVDGDVVAVDVRSGTARIEGDPTLLLAVASGILTLAAGVRAGLRVRGDRSVARAVLQPGKMPR